jgi:hypothetical protein
MEVSYTTTLDDFVAYNLYLYRKANMLRKPFIVCWSALFVLGGILGLIFAENWAFRAYGVVILLFAFSPLAFPLMVARQVRDIARKRGGQGLLGPTRLILTDESLTELTSSGKTETYWQNMAGIDEVGDHTFISITGLTAVILPRHGFEQAADYERARDFAMARFKDRDTHVAASATPVS